MTHTTEQLEQMLADATPGPWHLCAHLRDAAIDAGCGCGYRGVVYGPESEGFAVCQPGHDAAPKGQDGTEPSRYPRRVELGNAALIAAAPAITAELIAARKRIAELEAGLTFYAESHSQNPNEGPWGMSSTDYGTRARAALGDAQ